MPPTCWLIASHCMLQLLILNTLQLQQSWQALRAVGVADSAVPTPADVAQLCQGQCKMFHRHTGSTIKLPTTNSWPQPHTPKTSTPSPPPENKRKQTA
jgi:hypothetical protein